jgi:hypothetical protein
MPGFCFYSLKDGLTGLRHGAFCGLTPTRTKFEPPPSCDSSLSHLIPPSFRGYSKILRILMQYKPKQKLPGVLRPNPPRENGAQSASDRHPAHSDPLPGVSRAPSLGVRHSVVFPLPHSYRQMGRNARTKNLCARQRFFDKDAEDLKQATAPQNSKKYPA